MGDHLVLRVDRLVTPQSLESMQGDTDSPGSSLANSYSRRNAEAPTSVIDVEGVKEHCGLDEEEPLIQASECRICQEEDTPKNLEVPCSCRGSLKFAHRKCVQRWCNEKGDVTCEICNQPYQPGYTAPPPLPPSDDTAIDISEDWTISGTPLDFHDPRLLAVAAAERRHYLESEYDEYADPDSGGAGFCRAAALVMMALLFLRHALALPDPDEEDDASTFFSLFLLRAAGFLLPCYIIAWAISILQRRRQRQEAATLSATEVAYMLQAGQQRGFQLEQEAAALSTTEVTYMLQAGQQRGFQFTIAPGPTVTPHQESLQ